MRYGQETARVTERWDLGELRFYIYIHLQKFQTSEKDIGCLYGSQRQNEELRLKPREPDFVSI